MIIDYKKILIISIMLGILSGSAVLGIYEYERIGKQVGGPLYQGEELIQEQVKASSTQQAAIPIATTTQSGLKSYRNEEWGFEFQYPDDWRIRESAFKNYYSKFNLEIMPPGEIELFDPIVVNVVLPEFADRAFLGLNTTTSTVIVNSILGVKYVYEFEGTPEVDIVLPLEEYKMILGTKKDYEDVFNQIVSSFKFLK